MHESPETSLYALPSILPFVLLTCSFNTLYTILFLPSHNIRLFCQHQTRQWDGFLLSSLKAMTKEIAKSLTMAIINPVLKITSK